MDEMDYRILELLRENSREKNMEIARRLNVSEGTIRKRILNMVDSGIIKKFTVETAISIEGIVLIKLDSSCVIKKALERSSSIISSDCELLDHLTHGSMISRCFEEWHL